MKKYEVHIVGKGGIPLNCEESFMANSDKEALLPATWEKYFNDAVIKGHSGIHILKIPEKDCILQVLSEQG